MKAKSSRHGSEKDEEWKARDVDENGIGKAISLFVIRMFFPFPF